MYEIIAMVTKYVLIFLIYLFIMRIARLIYLDIKAMTVWEDSKVTSPHLKLLSSIERTGVNTVTEIFPLNNSLTRVGRSLECEIVITDPHISSQHLQIEKTGEGFTILDLGSVNGTYVNNVKLLNPVQLMDGDEILLGITKFVFSEGGKLHG
ncbi:MAG: FHA domain-containing protein [Clostridiales bacterium]|nr:FHA domain-containing protein [Clostridiales bacterium]